MFAGYLLVTGVIIVLMGLSQCTGASPSLVSIAYTVIDEALISIAILIVASVPMSYTLGKGMMHLYGSVGF